MTSHLHFKSFGAALSALLQERGLSNREFASQIDKNEAQVSHWINNRNMPYERTIRIIARALGVDFNQTEDGQWGYTDNILSLGFDPELVSALPVQEEMEILKATYESLNKAGKIFFEEVYGKDIDEEKARIVIAQQWAYIQSLLEKQNKRRT